jgi:hypothetical protein
MDEREHRRRRALTIALGLLREADSEELASTPRELWTDELQRRWESVLQLGVKLFVMLEDGDLADPRERAFDEALEKLIALCRKRDVQVPGIEEVEWLRERYVTPAAFHQDIVVEQLFGDLLELRRARGA